MCHECGLQTGDSPKFSRRCGSFVDAVTHQNHAIAIRNPDGRKQVQSSIDDYSSSFTVESGAAASGALLTEAEWARLEPTEPTGDGTSYSIILSYEYE